MSGEKKRQLIWYQPDDTGAIARHLEKMAARGWLLESADNLWYTYRRARPAQVKYAATFFPDASVFDPCPTEGQETYADYCRAAGWELAAVYGPIQYFRSTRPDPAPIETDEAVKLSAVRRTMRKTFVFSYAVLLALPAMFLPLFLSQFRRYPMEFFSSNSKLAPPLLMAGIALFAAGMLLDYLVWVLRSRYSVARGGSCARPHTRFRLGLTAGMIALCAAVIAVYLLDPAVSGLRLAFLLYLVLYGGVMALGRLVLRRLKKRGTSRDGARGLYIVFAIGAGVVMGVITPLLFGALNGAGVIRIGRKPVETYTRTYEGVSWTYTQDVFYDKLPVTLEDLGYTVTPEDHCTYEAEVSRSLLAVYGVYTQEALNSGSELPALVYWTYDTRWPWLLEQSWTKLTEDGASYEPWGLRRLDPAPWGAEEAYTREGLTHYFLRYTDRVAVFRLEGEVSPERLETIARALRP